MNEARKAELVSEVQRIRLQIDEIKASPSKGWSDVKTVRNLIKRMREIYKEIGIPEPPKQPFE